MRKQPKRAELIARRNTTTFRKRAKLKAAISNADKCAVRNPLKGEREVHCLDNGHGLSCMVSDLTSSSSTLDSLSSESESFYTQDDQETEKSNERPLITDFQSKDILQVMSALKLDFKEANRDKNDTMLPPFLQDLLFEITNYSKDDQKIVAFLDKATYFLWNEDMCKAEIQYQVRNVNYCID